MITCMSQKLAIFFIIDSRKLASLLCGFGDNYYTTSISFEIIRFSKHFRGQILPHNIEIYQV